MNRPYGLSSAKHTMADHPIDSADPALLLEALIELPSVTPNDAGCQGLIAGRLQKIGFTATALPAGNVSNLWLRLGEAPPLLLLAGHTDVVPPGPDKYWHSPPFIPTRRQGMLYGRGAVDMKGGLAAMICAVERFITMRAWTHGSLALLITSDEEGAAQDGTRHVVRWIEEQAIAVDWCLLGEPSSKQTVGDQVRIGRRGSLTGFLKVQGTQAHVAYPDQACNPIHRAIDALAALCQQQWDQGNAHYPPTSMQIVDLHAGDGTCNVIPGELDLILNFRYGTASQANVLQDKTETLLAAHDLKYQLQWQHSGEPFLSRQGTLCKAVQNACQKITGHSPALSTGGGTSDGRFIATLGTELLELGLVHSTMHQANECVALEELESLCQIYTSVLRQLLGNGGSM